MFVNPTSIFPTTGTILSRDARVTQSFAQVTDYLSDLQSHSTQFSVRRLAGRVQLGVPVERDVRLAEGRRRDARLRRRHHGQRSVSHAVGARRSRRAASDHVQRRLHVPSGGERHRVRPRSVGQSVHADGVGRRERRRLQQRPRVHLQSGDDHRLRARRPAMQSLLTERSELGARLSREAARHDRRQEQLPGSVVDEPQPARLARVAGAEDSRIARRSRSASRIRSPESTRSSTARTTCTAGARRRSPIRRCSSCAASIRRRSSTQYDVNPRFGANRQASALNLAPMQLTLDVRFDVGPERERQDLFLPPPHRSRRQGQQDEREPDQAAVRAHLSESVRADAAAAGFARAEQRRRRQHRDSQQDVRQGRSTRSGRRWRSTSRRCRRSTTSTRRTIACARRRTSRSTRWRSTVRRRSSC